MHFLITLWKFSRPHTIIGSFISVLSIYLVCLWEFSGEFSWPVLLLSLIAALGCNVYITGLNQLVDVELDRINKPWLPLASGSLSFKSGKRIVRISKIIAIISAVCLSFELFVLIVCIAAIGTAYSLPPLKFKRNHWLAAAAISVVRGLLVNIGFYWVFAHEFQADVQLNSSIGPLSLFVFAFSLGIAWFKDIPDTRGDAEHALGTLAVTRGRTVAHYAGTIVVSFAYLSMIVFGFLRFFPNATLSLIFHSVALLIFLYRAFRLNLSNDRSIRAFYLFFWALFFAEYIVYPFLVR